MNDISLYVGIGAGVCTAVSLIPQLTKIIKQKKAEDISFTMLFILLTGITAWIVYGVMKKDLPIVITNSFSFLINILVIIFSMIYKRI